MFQTTFQKMSISKETSYKISRKTFSLSEMFQRTFIKCSKKCSFFIETFLETHKYILRRLKKCSKTPQNILENI